MNCCGRLSDLRHAQEVRLGAAVVCGVAALVLVGKTVQLAQEILSGCPATSSQTFFSQNINCDAQKGSIVLSVAGSFALAVFSYLAKPKAKQAPVVPAPVPSAEDLKQLVEGATPNNRQRSKSLPKSFKNRVIPQSALRPATLNLYTGNRILSQKDKTEQ